MLELEQYIYIIQILFRTQKSRAQKATKNGGISSINRNQRRSPSSERNHAHNHHRRRHYQNHSTNPIHSSQKTTQNDRSIQIQFTQFNFKSSTTNHINLTKINRISSIKRFKSARNHVNLSKINRISSIKLN